MPISKSAQKAARSGERKRLRNRSVKSATKTNLIKAEKAIDSDDFELAQKAVTETIRILDKAAKKKVIHPNTASRRKSRLMKKLNKIMPSQTSKPEGSDKDTSTDTGEE